MLHRLLALLLLVAPAALLAQEAAAPATPGAPAVLIDDVNGLTVESGKILRFTGLVIDADGRVVARLAADARRPKNVAVVDGRGATLVPGFMDAHTHVMGLGRQLTELDLSATRSLAEAQAAIRTFAAERGGSGWIIGRGWNQERWGLDRFPTAAELDAAVADTPVYLERVDGHAAWVNTAALTAAKITARTPVPTGGRIEVAGGRPSGILVDRATDLVSGVIPPPPPVELNRAFLAAQEALIARGITAVADMGTTAADWLVIRRAADAGALRLRIVSYAGGLENALAVAGTGPTPWLYHDKLRMVGVKIYTDGALGSRGAWLKAPYADAPGQTGLPFLTDAELKNQMSRASMDRFQLAIHAIGDRANAQVLDAIEELAPTYTGDRRWRIEHAQVVDPADLPRFGANGVVASVQPTHQTSDRLMAEARLGSARLPGAYAWASLANGGARVALGSDTPVEAPDVLAGFATAISREDADGQPAGGWLPAERLTRAQALDGYTNTAAYAAFADDRWGRLAPGQWADFVLLDVDPATAIPAAIRAGTVLQTWLAGRPLAERR